MKKRSLVSRVMGFAGSAVLLAGLLAGIKAPAALTVQGSAYDYNVRTNHRYVVNADLLNVRSGPGYYYDQTWQISRGSTVYVLEVAGDWARIDQGWVNTAYLGFGDTTVTYPNLNNSPYSGIVTASLLNIRSGPGLGYGVTGRLPSGYQVNILDIQNGWGKIAEGWISLNYVSRTNYVGENHQTVSAPMFSTNSNVQITADALNVRQGPGTTYAKVDQLPHGTNVTLLETQDGWGRIYNGWISLNYVRTSY